jgi:hypothetical protein
MTISDAELEVLLNMTSEELLESIEDLKKAYGYQL